VRVGASIENKQASLLV